MFFGIASSFGDTTILGYLKWLAPDILVGYTSGTGISGLFSNLTIISLGFVFHDIYPVFLIWLFIPFLYFIGFFLINKRKLSLS